MCIVHIALPRDNETTNLIQGMLTWQFSFFIRLHTGAEINGHHRHPQIHLEVLALPQRPHPRNSAWDIKRNSMKQQILSNHHVFVQQLIIQSLWVLIFTYDILQYQNALNRTMKMKSILPHCLYLPVPSNLDLSSCLALILLHPGDLGITDQSQVIASAVIATQHHEKAVNTSGCPNISHKRRKLDEPLSKCKSWQRVTSV